MNIKKEYATNPQIDLINEITEKLDPSKEEEKMIDIMTVSVDLEVTFRRDGDKWVAWCIPLGVEAQGSSKEEARKTLQEVAELWIESCVYRGTFEGNVFQGSQDNKS